MENDPRKALDDALNEPLEERLRRAVADLDTGFDIDAGESTLLEIEDRINAISEEHRQKLSSDEEFEARMAALHAKVDRIQSARKATIRNEKKKQASDGKAAAGMGIGLSIAYTIIGCPIVGYGIGYLIDMQMGTTTARSYAAMVGIIIGMGAAFYLIQKSNSQL
jgi:F0F1-type ATP synthase assembly protein I